MDHMEQLNRAQGLLTQALSAALQSMPNNKSVQEARVHMKQALNELGHAVKTQTRKQTMNDSQFKTWWGNVMSGTAKQAQGKHAEQTKQAQAPMTVEAQHKSLASLNAMIADEKKNLEELEKQSIQPDAATQLFAD